MEKIKALLKWILASSENPQKTAATVKGILMILAPKIVLALGLMNFAVEGSQVQEIIDSITIAVSIFLTMAGTLYALYGVIRKIKNQVTGIVTKAPVELAPHDDRGSM